MYLCTGQCMYLYSNQRTLERALTQKVSGTVSLPAKLALETLTDCVLGFWEGVPEKHILQGKHIFG